MVSLHEDSSNLLSSLLQKPEMAERTINLSKHLNERNLKLKDLGITARTLNHWRAKQLLLENDNTHKYSLTEFVWIQIIDECRNFGLALDFIGQIKNRVHASAQLDVNLENLNMSQTISFIRNLGVAASDDEIKKMIEDIKVKNELSAFTILETLIIISVVHGNRTGIVISSERQIWGWIDLVKIEDDERIGSFLFLSVSKILEKYITLPKNALLIQDTPLLTVEEQEIFRLLNSTDVIEFNVKRKDNSKVVKFTKAKVVSEDEYASLIKNLLDKNLHITNVSKRPKGKVYIETVSRKSL